jgi:hypothetical protein
MRWEVVKSGEPCRQASTALESLFDKLGEEVAGRIEGGINGGRVGGEKF